MRLPGPRALFTPLCAVVILLTTSFCFAQANEKLIYVSDIDDTVIQSNVANKLALVRTAVLRKPKNAFDGMAVLYQNLLRDNPNASVMYLSGTPELMRKGMTRLLEQNHFPKGKVILRRWYPILSDITWGLVGDTILSSRRYKTRTLRKLLKENSDTSFVLIGDDVEYDADVYKQMRREFPEQVKQIYIRRVIGRLPLDPAISGVVQFSTEWHIGFSEYEEHRISAGGLIDTGTHLLERARNKPQLVYPNFVKSFLDFPNSPVRASHDLTLMASVKALAYDLNKAIGTIAHCQMQLLGGVSEAAPALRKSQPLNDDSY